MTFFLITLICLVVATAILLGARRRLVALNASCEAAASEVDAAAERLHALFPAVVGLMHAFSPQDREATDLVAKAHAAALKAASPQAKLLAERRLVDGVCLLLARAQAVPQIERMSDFRELRLVLEEGERRLAAARRNLSLATAAYNRALQRFPESLFAMRMRLTPRVFYDIAVDRPLADEAAA